MIYFTCAIILGGLSCLQLDALPNISIGMALLLLPLFFCKQRYLSLSAAFVFGFLYISSVAHVQLERRISTALENIDIQVVGTVEGLPRQQGDRVSFRLNVESSQRGSDALPFKGLVKLNWYRNLATVTPGQQWQFLVRLKAPRAYANPGGFDYEKWLFSEHIVATGYIRKNDNNKLLLSAPRFSIDAIRYQIRQQLVSLVELADSQALMVALLIGDRSLISQQQWELFRRLGINHLVAISGLHVGIVAMVFYSLTMWMWWLIPQLALLFTRQSAATVAAMSGAVFYSALAGFSVSTQRALLMILLLGVAKLLRYPVKFSHIIALAVLLLYLWDPLMLLSVSFYLSFLAVVFIAYALASLSRRNGIRLFVRIQFVISVGMIPILLFLFGQFSVISPAVNMLMIPLFSWLIIPALLILLPFVLMDLWWAHWLMLLFADALHWLLQTLARVAVFPVFEWSAADVPPLVWGSLFLLVFLFLLPRLLPRKVIALLACIPLLLYLLQVKQPVFFRMTVLDVGQGTSVVLETRSQLWIYDTGAAFKGGRAVAKTVLQPYLQSLSRQHIDTLVLSHSDNDHAGGAGFLRDNYSVGTVYSGEAIAGINTLPCQQGKVFDVDGLEFRFLWPRTGSIAEGNNSSCVLKITGFGVQALLTGDIEHTAEKQLIHSEMLSADVVVIPHHGSKTSSSQAFVLAVSPKYAISTSGYLNRWGFPKADIVERWRIGGAAFLDTAKHGAIIYQCAKDGACQTKSYRQQINGFWRYR